MHKPIFAHYFIYWILHIYKFLPTKILILVLSPGECQLAWGRVVIICHHVSSMSGVSACHHIWTSLDQQLRTGVYLLSNVQSFEYECNIIHRWYHWNSRTCLHMSYNIRTWVVLTVKVQLINHGSVYFLKVKSCRPVVVHSQEIWLRAPCDVHMNQILKIFLLFNLLHQS